MHGDLIPRDFIFTYVYDTIHPAGEGITEVLIIPVYITGFG